MFYRGLQGHLFQVLWTHVWVAEAEAPAPWVNSVPTHIYHQQKTQVKHMRGFWEGWTSFLPAATCFILLKLHWIFPKRGFSPHFFSKDKANIGKRWNWTPPTQKTHNVVVGEEEK